MLDTASKSRAQLSNALDPLHRVPTAADSATESIVTTENDQTEAETEEESYEEFTDDSGSTLPPDTSTESIAANDTVPKAASLNETIEAAGSHETISNTSMTLEEELHKPYGGYGMGGGKVYARMFPEVSEGMVEHF